jgi:hypothetical protein
VSRPVARKLIVTSNLVTDADMTKHGPQVRRYMRLGSGGTGQRVPPTALNIIRVPVHPLWTKATGEKTMRLHWCERCKQYTEWVSGECQNE